ncbi:proline hydroxylase [Actinomadura sp. KC06]|uniref:proline hydroxylase n=1 Tax=Actinomadura sp. KC06 TaxID=2530369 RepID=UPI001048484D|nr:proline hydroxylase [Actinomadura sp. KC06]TDD38197.1 proline hydroxylase [Actinomadura sp. KC06]
MSGTALDPTFTAVDSPAFSRAQIEALATGGLAALRVPRLFGPDLVGGTVGRLHRLPAADYQPARTAMTRFGPALNDYRHPDGGLDADRYWHDAETARAQWRGTGFDPDPTRLCLDALGDAWGEALRPATIGGRPAFVGMLREINAGTLIHYDDIRLEYPDGLFDQEIVAQLTFNLWLVVPGDGGETTVWRHRWALADDVHRHKYGYTPAVVENYQEVTVTPELGDGLLFNPNNYHTVRPNGEGHRRITLAFFFGLTPEGSLVAWS